MIFCPHLESGEKSSPNSTSLASSLDASVDFSLTVPLESITTIPGFALICFCSTQHVGAAGLRARWGPSGLSVVP